MTPVRGTTTLGAGNQTVPLPHRNGEVDHPPGILAGAAHDRGRVLRRGRAAPACLTRVADGVLDLADGRELLFVVNQGRHRRCEALVAVARKSLPVQRHRCRAECVIEGDRQPCHLPIEDRLLHAPPPACG